MRPEVRELLDRLPRWLEPATNRAVRFANRRPAWMPRQVSLLPLRACIGVLRLYQWRVL